MIIYKTKLSAISEILGVYSTHLSALALASLVAKDRLISCKTNLSAISEILRVSSANLSALALASLWRRTG